MGRRNVVVSNYSVLGKYTALAKAFLRLVPAFFRLVGATTGAAVFDFIPNFLPFFSPGKGSFTYVTKPGRQVLLLEPFRWYAHDKKASIAC